MNDVKDKNNSILNSEISKYFLLIAFVIIIIGFGIAKPIFLSVENVLDIIREASIVGLMGLGMTMGLAAGEFDFSIGATATVAALVAGKVLSSTSIDSTLMAFAIGLIICGLIGMINSFNRLVIGMPAFIATLGMATFAEGVSKYITGGSVFYSVNWPDSFGVLGKGFVFRLIPIPALVFVIITIICIIFLHKTKTGRYIYSVGNNPSASAHVGIHCDKIILIAYVCGSILTGIAGLIQGSMLGSISPLMGSGNLLKAITTSMLGATFFMIGSPNIPGTFVGALVISCIANGLTMLGASYFMKDIITGIILLISVGFISIVKRERLANIGI